MTTTANQPLTTENAKPGLKIAQTAHPEYGVWRLSKDDGGFWIATKQTGSTVVGEGEFRFWHIVA